MSEKRIKEKYKNQIIDFVQLLANEMKANNLISFENDSVQQKGNKTETSSNENEVRSFSNELNKFLIPVTVRILNIS